MLKTFSVLLVVVALLFLPVTVSTSVSAQTTQDATQAEKIKQQAVAFGDGARVALKLRDKKKLTGHINYVGKDSLTITDDKTKASLTVAYTDVTEIERKKENDGGFPKKAKVGLVILGVLFVMGMVANGGG